MRIQSLVGKLRSKTVLIVGTGPSMRVTPLTASLFSVFPVIGLNQAYKYVPTTLSITVHPELLAEYHQFVTTHPTRRPEFGWVVKKKPPMAHLEFDDPEYYVFSTSPDITTVTSQPNDVLYIGEGIQCTALDLAARLGADTAILVGCDACSLGGDFHGHDQHVRWLGREPDDQFYLYRERTSAVRRVLRERGMLNVLTLTPFIGANSVNEDYDRLCRELDLPKLPPPKDVSPYLLPESERKPRR